MKDIGSQQIFVEVEFLVIVSIPLPMKGQPKSDVGSVE